MRLLRLFIILFLLLLIIDMVFITALGKSASSSFRGAPLPEPASGSSLPGILITVIAVAGVLLLGFILRATFEKPKDTGGDIEQRENE